MAAAVVTPTVTLTRVDITARTKRAQGTNKRVTRLFYTRMATDLFGVAATAELGNELGSYRRKLEAI